MSSRNNEWVICNGFYVRAHIHTQFFQSPNVYITLYEWIMLTIFFVRSHLILDEFMWSTKSPAVYKATQTNERTKKKIGKERKIRWIKRAIYRMKSRDEIKLNDFVCANGWMVCRCANRYFSSTYVIFFFFFFVELTCYVVSFVVFDFRTNLSPNVRISFKFSTFLQIWTEYL